MPCHTHGGMKCAICIPLWLEGYAGPFCTVLREVNAPASKCKLTKPLARVYKCRASGFPMLEHETATNCQTPWGYDVPPVRMFI